jgi:tripartite-type tricarboxylate transporter receptor subunit TctC
MKKLWHIVATSLIIPLLVWRVFIVNQMTVDGEYPNRAIQVVVPYAAGGGTDVFARLLTRSMSEDEQLGASLAIMNQPGGSGTIGSRFVKNAKPDGYRILCHHESIMTAQLSGTAPFGSEAFEPIAHSGNIVLLIVVRDDAPYDSVRDLLDAAKQAPKTIRFGADRGSPAHFTALKLEGSYPGAKLNLITSGGGQKRHIGILGGHLDAGIFSLAEFLGYVDKPETPANRNIRALAVLSSERHPTLPQVHTCVEDGVDATSRNAYYWWAPKETPTHIIDKLADAIERAMKDETVLERLEEWSISTEFTRGQPLIERVDRRLSELQPLAVQVTNDLPNFPLYTGIAAALLLTVVITRPRHSSQPITDAETQKPQTSRAAICFLIQLAFVGTLQLTEVPFSLAAALMIFMTGITITGRQKHSLVLLVEIALLTALGSEFIFTQVFAVALP